MDIIILTSNRLCVRSFKVEDAEAVFTYRSLNEIAKYQYWEPYTMEQAIAFVEQYAGFGLNRKNEWTGLAIINKADGKLIGDCALKISDEGAEVGCNISPEYQKKGYAREALLLLLNYLFAQVGIKEVYGITDSANVASIRLMESLGMEREVSFEEKVICKGVLSIEHKYRIV